MWARFRQQVWLTPDTISGEFWSQARNRWAGSICPVGWLGVATATKHSSVSRSASSILTVACNRPASRACPIFSPNPFSTMGCQRRKGSNHSPGPFSQIAAALKTIGKKQTVAIRSSIVGFVIVMGQPLWDRIACRCEMRIGSLGTQTGSRSSFRNRRLYRKCFGITVTH